MIWEEVDSAISGATGEPFVARERRGVGGGCINDAFRIGDGERDFFVKVNRAEGYGMFEAEAAGLEEMAATGTLRVPRPVCHGVAGDSAWLVLEYLEMGGGSGGAAMGEGLAAMHRCTADRYGWWRDNTIGSTPQPNGWMDDWLDFWRERRLGFQLGLAGRRGIGRRALGLGERLMADLPGLFTGYTPEPSLLHGDLWGGNAGLTRDGEPVIFDPATYYGDREAEIAMTELFGGFGGAFRAAYEAAWPLDPGYRVRKTLYNLYHILNHYNLFGGGYGSQAETMMERLLAEL